MAAHYNDWWLDFIGCEPRKGDQILQTLWDHAVSTYGRTGVARACLDLQDRSGADVNLLLTASWLAQQGRCWGMADVAALVRLCADWRMRCVLPLREVRRYLAVEPGNAELYRQAKALELAAERRQLEMIETWLSVHPAAAAPSGTDTLQLNLDRYLSSLNGADAKALATALSTSPGC